ncbi:MAG: zinc ribbon domain-containing protein, partial [Gemmatimonadetes bacterium]|nr:zinc ribbon domain-containing protein [Gemmatimonadota bacterium]
HRDRIGVEMNGDYEDALLRLLAGEGDYLVLESEHARRELQGELESSNPNTGLFREFAAADVRLNHERLPPSLSAPDQLPGDSVTFDMSDETPVPVEDLARPGGPSFSTSPARREDDLPLLEENDDDDDTAPAAEALRPSPPSGPAANQPPSVVSSTPAGEDCRWCREPLPRREPLNYCPFCGANAHLVPCPNCGEELEAAWRFCVACGTEVGDSV